MEGKSFIKKSQISVDIIPIQGVGCHAAARTRYVLT